ncbi:type II secretion system protein [Coraliomargarita sp. SDUM461004]|uniref:Type II secretion system protein n=1 Tax=Thalassobacterium sedimentorum TaxID=3041258 RepID=A0ABU1AH29_9BACT|nr:type II secretion system protein [Coraliomargarita sp. SDUM461004]MDQ8194054.1 type II secretion system protein [Coraliomargarita sp. SDUM461004]
MAFSLIELLSVIGIVAILAAILMPVVGRVREQASRTANASQIRQVGSAFLMHTSLLDGRGPSDYRSKDANGNSSSSISEWARRGKYILFGELLPHLDVDMDHFGYETPDVFISPVASDHTLDLVRRSQETNFWMNPQLTSIAGKLVSDLPIDRVAIMDVCKWWSPSIEVNSNRSEGFYAFG